MRSPKSILITGGSSGIGEALALEYAAPGIRLALTGRSVDRLEAVAEACRAKGAEVGTHIADVRDAAAMRAWIEEEDAKSPLDLVIANAGVSSRGFHEMDQETRLRTVIATNLDGVINTVQPALDRTKSRWAVKRTGLYPPICTGATLPVSRNRRTRAITVLTPTTKLRRRSAPRQSRPLFYRPHNTLSKINRIRSRHPGWPPLQHRP